ncbi:MAG: phosphatase PAP2 family protein [Acidimicrobiales bacterium]
MFGVGAVLLRLHPAPNPLDRAGFHHIGAAPRSDLYDWVSRLGTPAVLIGGCLLAALLAVRSDRGRAMACLAGPFICVLLVEYAFKPLVGRRFEGVLSFPSGNVAAVGAMATALVLAVRRRARPLLCLLGAVAVGAMMVSVVGLRWHYPTDALGGSLLGVGTVLVVDSLLHGLGANRHRQVIPTGPPG